MIAVKVLIFTFVFLQGVMPFEWTTQTTIPNRMTMIACKGQNVTLGWKYNTSTTEHELTVEWFYRAPGHEEEVIAILTMGIFVEVPSSKRSISFVPNAGIRLADVSPDESGLYSIEVTLDRHGSVVTHGQSITLNVSDTNCNSGREMINLIAARVHALEVEYYTLSQENALLHAQLQQLPANRDFYERPRSCVDVQRYDASSGVHTLYTSDSVTIPVFCDQTSDGGGWAVIQRREDGSVDFFRDWADYEDGFGYLEGEFWLGLAKMYHLTTDQPYTLRIDMTNENGHAAYAQYRSFRLGGWDSSYTLSLSGYTGTAGDSIIRSYWQENQNHQPFSTRDHGQQDTAYFHYGGWWYMYEYYRDYYSTYYYYDTTHSPPNFYFNNHANLNGNYTNDGGRALFWLTFNPQVPLKKVEMKIRPT